MEDSVKNVFQNQSEKIFDDLCSKMNSKIYDSIENLKISLNKLIEEEKPNIIKKLNDISNVIFNERQKNTRLMELLSQKKILLDVGGVFYATTLNTLTKYKNSKLASLFSGDYTLEFDADGRFFIDRNGEYFKYILDSLRNDELVLPQSSELRDLVLKEFSFFGLKEFSDKFLEKSIAIPEFFLDNNCVHATLELSNNNMTVKKKTSNSHASVLGNLAMTEGIYSWDIEINNLVNSHWIGIGVCDKSEITKNFTSDYDKSYMISSKKQFYKTAGNILEIQQGWVINCCLNFIEDIFTIKGPNNLDIKNQLSFKGKTLYVIFNLFTVGNQLTVKNFKKIK